MANYVSKATGAWLTAGTWYNVENQTRGVQATYSTATNTTTSYVYNADAQDFTGTNLKDCVGILMYCKQTTATGTVTISLSADSGTTDTVSLAVNATDLPLSPSWVFFKFASALTLDGGADYAIGIKGSSVGNATFYRDATTANWTHLVVWSDSPVAAPTTSDVIYIAGVQTGAAAETACVVTMDETATTDYGAVHIGNIGSLTYDITSAHNPYLKLSGNLNVWGDGTLNIGDTGGGAVPRDSVAVLEFDPTSDGEFGLIINAGATFNSQGLSRTTGKNVFSTTLAGDVTQKTANVTATSASPMVVTWAGNTLGNGDKFQFTGTTAPGGTSLLTTYYVVNNAVDGVGKFRLSLTSGGADINSSSTGTALVGWATSDLDLTVTDDTGWLSGDTVIIASTTQTATQTEPAQLSENAGATTLTFANGIVYGHSGTSPTQAEVVLLTRNVVIRSATSTLMTYVFYATTSTVDIDWTEFYYLGENAVGKLGIDIATTTGSFNMQYSSVHDCEDRGINMSSTSVVATLSYNVFDNLSTTSSTYGLNLNGSSSCVFTYNMISRGTAMSSGGFIYLGASFIGGNFSNNNIFGVGGATSRTTITFGGTGTIGTFSDNVIHSCANIGLCSFSAILVSGTISNLTAWRNATCVIQTQGADSSSSRWIGNLIFDGWVCFGNATSTIEVNYDCGNLIINNLKSSGDSSFATTRGLGIQNADGSGYAVGIYLRVYNSNFSPTDGINVEHSVGDINLLGGADNGPIRIYLYNTILGSTVADVASPTNFKAINNNDYAFIKSTKHNQTTGANLVHKSWFKYGTIITDLTVFNTAAPSMKMTPNSATAYTLESGSFKVNVNSGETVTPSVYVRQSEAAEGDSADYNGSKPRLVLKRNDAIGVTADAVIDTATNAIGNPWEQLTGAMAAPATENGVAEFVIQCDGTTGFVNVDDFTATVA